MKQPSCIPFRVIALLAATALAACAAPQPEDAVRLRLELDRTVLPARTTDRAVIKVCLDGLRLPRSGRRPPVNLALVIDRSGSMSGEKLVRARQAAHEAVRRLAPDDLFSLIAYESRVETLIPACRVGDGREIDEAIDSLCAGGCTALFGGVAQGASEVRRHLDSGRYVNRIILLSDGLANVGPSSPEELGSLGGALVKEGIAVTTVGLGLDFNEDLMTQLARRSDGNTYFVEDSGDLPRIFAAELGDVLSVVAHRVVITIEFPDGVRPLRFVGRDGVIRGQRAELALNQLYGGQEKFALIEVEVQPGEAGAEREIARAQVTYEDAGTRRAARLAARSSVRFDADRRAVVGSANHQVQVDYAANVIAIAKDQAVALVDSGRRDEAARELRKQVADLKVMAETYGNAPVAQAAVASSVEADRLERQGLDNAARKTYRAESSQIRNQQSSR